MYSFTQNLTHLLLASNDCIELIAINSQRKELIRKILFLKLHSTDQEDQSFRRQLSVVESKGSLLLEQESLILSRYQQTRVQGVGNRQVLVGFCKSLLQSRKQKYIELMIRKDLQRYTLEKKKVIEKVYQYLSQDLVDFYALTYQILAFYRQQLLLALQLARALLPLVKHQARTQMQSARNFLQFKLDGMALTGISSTSREHKKLSMNNLTQTQFKKQTRDRVPRIKKLQQCTTLNKSLQDKKDERAAQSKALFQQLSQRNHHIQQSIKRFRACWLRRNPI